MTEKSDPWVNRSSMMTCRTCMWYITKVKSGPKVSMIGRCRKNAPTISGFPVVFLTDWCGQHKLDENYTNE